MTQKSADLTHFLPGGSLISSIVLLCSFIADKRFVYVHFFQEFELAHLYIINICVSINVSFKHEHVTVKDVALKERRLLR